MDKPQRQGVALIPDPASDPARQENHNIDYSFVEEVIQDGRKETLPAVDEDFPEAVRKLVEEEESKRFYVFPPFGNQRELPNEVRESLKGEFRGADLSTIATLSVLKSLGKEDKAAFTLPSLFFSSQQAGRYRKQSLEVAHPELIIRPPDSPFVDSIVQVQTIIYSGSSSVETPITRFFSIPEVDEVTAEEAIDDFEQLLRQGGGETTHGFVHRNQLNPSETWTYESLNPELKREIEEVEKLGEIKPLEELFELKIGRPPTNYVGSEEEVELDSEAVSETQDGVPVIEGRDVRADGSLSHDDTRRQVRRSKVEKSGLLKLQDGDICIRRVSGSKTGVVAGEVEQHMTPLVSSHNVVVLRPKAGTTQEDRKVVLQYLRSKTAARYLRAKELGAGHIRLTVGRLRELPVPLADEDLREALGSLLEAADLFDTWKEEALDAAQSLFDHPTAEDGKMHVLTTGRRSRQRQHAAERQDDLSYRIQTQFPHPVAYRWRTVAAAKPDLEGYLHVLECAEVLTCYLALVALTMAQDAGKEIGYLEEMGRRVADGRGTNLGDWIAILREVRDSKSFRKLPDDTPFYEVMHFVPTGRGADEALSSLKNRRDKQAHGKGPRGDSVRPAFEDAKDSLLVLLDAAEFLSEYPLRYVDRTQADTIQDCLTYWYRDIMGDHPLVPVEEDTTAPKTLEAGSLYLVDRSGSLHLLRPLLDRRRCPVCGTWSTFYLDSYVEDGDACLLKSMEHSHTTQDEEIYEAFQQIGLLPNKT
ncbi:hypothetical protein [Salinibacter ruber]|nr:hypothetical protein [Salinibacter ruber]